MRIYLVSLKHSTPQLLTQGLHIVLEPVDFFLAVVVGDERVLIEILFGELLAHYSVDRKT